MTEPVVNARSSSLRRAALERLVAKPRSLADTGLSQEFLVDLVSKHLYREGVLDLRQLTQLTALPGNILDVLLEFLRRESRIETRSADASSAGLRYVLSERGRDEAVKALATSAYVGPAPVPLTRYVELVQAQSVHARVISPEVMRAAYTDVVLPEKKLDQLGPAVHSGRAIMVYGLPGTGKTYVCQRLARTLGDTIFVPHALVVDNSVIQLFDPLVHRRAEDACKKEDAMVSLDVGYDARFVRCQRPELVTGGELTLEMLDLRMDPLTRQYQAPVHLKANNGVYVLDDLGRQRVHPDALFNRWIVPMEEKKDYLTLETGRRFQVPFDVVLVFSTNMNPLELADEAFLRRLGYKIRFDPVDVADYLEIWRRVCEERGVAYDLDVLERLLEHYRSEEKPLLPCHPRDLLGLVIDYCHYRGQTPVLSWERVREAWDIYFVKVV